MKKYLSLLTALLLVFSTSAFAVPMTFFGEDLGLGESTRLSSFPNSIAAESSFLSNLIGVGTESFEGFANGAGAPLGVNFGAAGTATLLGGNNIATVASGTNGAGRYPTSGVNYWETSSNLFKISFSAPVAAFGFYGIDFGDFQGQIVAEIDNGADPYEIPHTIGGRGGSVIFWGIIDTENPFSAITFSNTGSGQDYFGFDDFTIGSVEQVIPSVPEPSTMLLLGLGLLGVAGIRRRTK